MTSNTVVSRLVATVILAAWTCNVVAKPLACGDRAPDSSRLAVAGGSLVEIIYALGEEARLVAVDSTSNYPIAAKELPQLGYVRAVSAEGLLALEPTLVLGEHDMGPPAVMEQLDATGIDLLLVPEDFTVDGIREKILCVAAVLGIPDRGEDLAKKVLSGLDDQVASRSTESRSDGGLSDEGGITSKPVGGVVLLGLRAGAPVAAGIETSGDGLLQLAGARNLMPFEGWKPISLEMMAEANPEFIVIPQRGVDMAGGLEALLAHPALRYTSAATSKNVVVMDGMAMLGFGPRTVAAAAELKERIEELNQQRVAGEF